MKLWNLVTLDGSRIARVEEFSDEAAARRSTTLIRAGDSSASIDATACSAGSCRSRPPRRNADNRLRIERDCEGHRSVLARLPQFPVPLLTAA
jgi:hypothetical protein